MSIPARVLLFGDSITAEIGAASQWFGVAAVDWTTAGYAGYTSADLLAVVLAATPPLDFDQCAIQCGLNDITTGVDPAVTHSNIAAIVAAFRALGVTPYLGTTLPLYSSYPVATTYNVAIDALNAWATIFALSNRVPLIDYHATFDLAGVSPALFRPGEAHPNVAGNALYMATAGRILSGAPVYAREIILRDVPAASNETVLGFATFDGTTIGRANVTLRPGDSGYTGTGMSDAALDALARLRLPS